MNILTNGVIPILCLLVNLTQTVIIRTDLFDKSNVGLISAQVAHIHLEGFRQAILGGGHWDDDRLTMAFPNAETAEAMEGWLADPYIFVRRVPCLEVLEYFERKINASNGLTCDVWTDTVFIDIAPEWTEGFADVKVGLSIGPADADVIKAIVGKLPLL